ncbi:hypothetical protein [Streptomyces sp. GD-15H]|uniref:hypothetical protein n=1 Tax=Streptomyces sp. GD-15H TaxID=3129112 RepID=UPI003872D664
MVYSADVRDFFRLLKRGYSDRLPKKWVNAFRRCRSVCCNGTEETAETAETAETTQAPEIAETAETAETAKTAETKDGEPARHRDERTGLSGPYVPKPAVGSPARRAFCARAPAPPVPHWGSIG